MKISRKARTLALAAALVVAGTGYGYGQAIYGSLYGTVTDPTGAAIPNATVTVTDIAKGTSVTVTSNDSGAYTVEHLIPDSYSIKITAPGFQGYQATGINVAADSAPKVDAKLTVGDAGTTVQVTADALPTLTTDRAEVSTQFNARNTEDLPLPNRNFTGLQLLLPGTQLLGWSHASSENPQGSQQIIVNGQHFAGVAYELDGTDNQDPILGLIVVNPSLDSVRESKIATQNYDAQFGKAVAAVVTAQTKSGGNSVHGGVFDFRQSDANRAKNPFDRAIDPTSATPAFRRIVPVALQSQFGGSLGGPIKKDQLFFFVDYQGVRSKVGTSTGYNTVPTLLLKNSCAAGACNFSDYVRADASGNVVPGYVTPSITNPLTNTVYANAIIPAAQLNPAALRLLALYPNPNLAGAKTSDASGISGRTPGGTAYQNFAAAGTGVFNYDQGTIRLDAQVNDKIHYFNRFSYFTDTLTGATAFGALGGPGFGTGGFGGTSRGHNASWSTGADVIVSPKWVTDIRFGYLRYSIATTKYDGNENFATNNGIPGLNLATGNTGGAPEFDLEGVPGNNINNDPGANFGSGLGVNRCNCPLTENERQYQVVNNWTHELGNHSIKFGIDFRHAYNLRVPSDSNRAGVLTFQTKTTQQYNAQGQGTGGLSFASFVLGDVGQFARYVSISTTAAETQNRIFEYVQDTWRATPKLTINYGVRYENYLPEKTEAGLGSILNLQTGNFQISHQGSYGGGMGVSNNFSLVAPRAGVAYQIDPKTVIRAGYGRSFDIGVFGSIFGHAVTQNLPVLAKQSNSSSANVPIFQLGAAPPAANFGGTAVNGNLPLPDGINANARPTTERFPTLDAWNAQVQRDLGRQFNLTIGYVGNKGTHTFAGDGSTTNPNQVALSLNGLTYGVNSPSGDARRRPLYSRYNFADGHHITSDINYFSSDADTHFNALQVTLDKRFSQGYQFVLNYAHQIAKNYNGDYFQINKAIEYGNQDDLRQDQITFFGNLELPFGHGKPFASNVNGFMDRLINGWELSPTMNAATGLPFWPSYNQCGLDRDTGPCTPNYSGSGFSTGIKGGQATGLTFFTPVPDITTNTGSVFTRPGVAKFGNLPRNSFFGPKFFNADLAAQKNIRIKESATVIFRTDFFNVLNHVSYANPNATIDGNGGGSISGYAPGYSPRQLQFAVRVKF